MAFSCRVGRWLRSGVAQGSSVPPRNWNLSIACIRLGLVLVTGCLPLALPAYGSARPASPTTLIASVDNPLAFISLQFSSTVLLTYLRCAYIYLQQVTFRYGQAEYWSRSLWLVDQTPSVHHFNAHYCLSDESESRSEKEREARCQKSRQRGSLLVQSAEDGLTSHARYAHRSLGMRHACCLSMNLT